LKISFSARSSFFYITASNFFTHQVIVI